MPRPITPSTSLENLRKTAKLWLKAMRAGNLDARARFEHAYPGASGHPVLRHVQHALAREYGYENWPLLSQAVAKIALERPPAPGMLHSLDVYERVAEDLVLAHIPRDEGALARLNAHFHSRFSFDDVAATIWRGVYAYRERAFRGDGSGITLPEAQTLIAQLVGFGSWEMLAKGVAEGGPPIPPFVIEAEEHKASPTRLMSDAEWDHFVEVLRAQKVTRLETALMTDALLARIVDLTDITSLSLGGSLQLTDKGLQQLARMPQLERLSLSEYPGGHLTDRGLDVVRHLPNLRVFEMFWQRGVSDSGIANLAYCDKLERVELMGTMTGDGAIRALQGKPRLASFSTGRLLTDEGLALLNAFPGFKVRSNAARDQGGRESERAGRLLIDGPFSDQALAHLVPLEGIRELVLFWHVARMTSAGFASLVDVPNLEVLGADGALSDNTAMTYFAKMPRLKQLRAQETVATDEGFEALSASKTLEGFWGRRCEGLGNRGFAALATMPALRSLGVSCQHVDDKALALLPSFPSLRELTPINMQDAGFRHVGRCERLDRLTCMYCRETTDAATAHITDLQIRYYYAGLTRITDRSLELLGGMPSLEEIELYECQGVTDAGLTSLAGLPRLRRIELSGLKGVTFAGTKVFPSGVRVRYST